MKTTRLHYFRLNYYAGFDFSGFPIGSPIESHDFNAPHSSVELDTPSMFPGACLAKAASFAVRPGAPEDPPTERRL